jgi:hypothetical protein
MLRLLHDHIKADLLTDIRTGAQWAGADYDTICVRTFGKRTRLYTESDRNTLEA